MLFEDLVGKAKASGVELLHGRSDSESRDLMAMHLKVDIPLTSDQVRLVEDGIKLVKAFGANRLYVHTKGLEVLK